MREWTMKSFNYNLMIDNESGRGIKKLADLNKLHEKGKMSYDVDLIVRVLQIFKLNDQKNELRVIDDSNEVWFTEVYISRFRWLKEGQYVKIKTANVYEHGPRFFSLRFASNILSLPFNCQIARTMKDKMKIVEAMKELD